MSFQKIAQIKYFNLSKIPQHFFMVSVEMLKVPVFFNGDTVCYAASTSTVGASARQEFYLIHWVPSNTPVGIKSCHFGVMGAGLACHPSANKKGGPRCIPKTEAVRYPLLSLVNRRRSGKLTMFSYFLGEYYHHIGFFPWPC